MKEYNVLEASGLCMNGNKHTDYAEPYAIICAIQNTMRSLRKVNHDFKPPFEKGTHVRRPIGENPEPIIMRDDKVFEGDGIVDDKPKGILNIAEPFILNHPITEATKAIKEAERKLEKDEYGLYIHARGYTETRDRMDKYFKK